MRILNFGSMNIDYVYSVDHILQEGETLLSDDRHIFTGGKGMNQSVAMGRAGLPVWHAGCVGEEGKWMLEELRKSNVDVSLVKVRSDVPSGHTVIQKDREGRNCIMLFGGANRMVSEEQADETLTHFGEGDVLVLQNEISSLSYIMTKAHEKGMKIIMNPSPVDAVIPTLPLVFADLFFVNEIEASQITECSAEDTEALLEGLRQKFPDAKVVLTLGGAGSVYMDREKIVRQPAVPVHVADTTAAGDTFSGYFLAGFLQDMPVEAALKLAAAAAGIAVSRAGAAPSIPFMKEVQEYI